MGPFKLVQEIDDTESVSGSSVFPTAAEESTFTAILLMAAESPHAIAAGTDSPGNNAAAIGAAGLSDQATEV